MKKLLQILGVIFLILVVLAIGSLIAFRVAFKKYEEAEEFCVKSSRAEVMKLYKASPKDEKGTAQVNNTTLQSFEKEVEEFYHKCMNDKNIPDSFLELKSPYLFD